MEELAVREDLLHRVHLRAIHNIGRVCAVFLRAGLEDLLHNGADAVSVLCEHHVLEIVYADVKFSARTPCEPVRQGGYGADVIVSDVPAKGEDAAGLFVNQRVEHKVGHHQILGHDGGIFFHRAAEWLDDSRSQLQAEIRHGTHAEQRHLGDVELQRREFHVVEYLLQERILAGLRGLVHHNVLSLSQEIGQYRDLGLAAHERTAGNRAVEYKRSVHRVTKMFCKVAKHFCN